MSKGTNIIFCCCPIKCNDIKHVYSSMHERFPLLDKPRLQKWVDNMRREEWTPSRHQYLCSEHFTEDCFDIRWGIRYLKNTAIPTVFPSVEEVCILQHSKNIIGLMLTPANILCFYLRMVRMFPQMIEALNLGHLKLDLKLQDPTPLTVRGRSY